jgi:diguanylate cyclase (GGDEF)-like protein
LFNDRLNVALAQAYRNLGKLAVLFLDLDGFKGVNDQLGHAAGDVLLKQVAQRLKGCVRDSDTIARLGGDEFVVILTRLKSISTAGSIANSIIANLCQPIQIENKTVKIGASIGLSIYPQDGKNSTDLLKNSDLAMYRAKEAGRNCYRAYSAESIPRACSTQPSR